jgi:hypothetical protein
MLAQQDPVFGNWDQDEALRRYGAGADRELAATAARQFA